MFGLPKSTEFNKRIPKQKFYENISVTSALKKSFVEQVKTIVWKNKLAPATLNVAGGQIVQELQIFEVRLNQMMIDENILRQIDKAISYHILYLLEYEGKYQACIAYKEISESGISGLKENQYYHTEWSIEEKLSLRLDGLGLDDIYSSYVRQIAGSQLQVCESGESIKKSVERSQKKAKLEKQIKSLEGKICREKQLNRKMQWNAELKRLKIEWEEMDS
ncbi:DUF4391 domain-containing protein [Pectinatus sottacetonis]|uniref:DUF4391 domain-containing protein n=1 Tax=Pectinatus sottacetonis TaxID=1002795 RepID=UPI0018C464AC|nr:DUF4391 domain-containing protein [Pectinatus sottacetonis]